MNFKVGDRIKALGSVAGMNLKGAVGTIIKVRNHDEHVTYGIAFEESFSKGHRCEGLCKDYHGRWTTRGDKFELCKITDWKKRMEALL